MNASQTAGIALLGAVGEFLSIPGSGAVIGFVLGSFVTFRAFSTACLHCSQKKS